jgi:hypothetical protein
MALAKGPLPLVALASGHIHPRSDDRARPFLRPEREEGFDGVEERLYSILGTFDAIKLLPILIERSIPQCLQSERKSRSRPERHRNFHDKPVREPRQLKRSACMGIAPTLRGPRRKARPSLREPGPDSLRARCVLVGTLYSRQCSILLHYRLETNKFHRFLGSSIAPPNKETLVRVDPALQSAVRTG